MSFYAKRSGFLLLDALLGAALFAVFIAAVGVTILVGQIGFLRSGDSSRAVFLSEKGLEAVRSIRDADWDTLTAGGPYGVDVAESGTWEFSGTGTTTSDGFTTSVTLTTAGTDAFLVTSSTTWHISSDRTGHVELVSLVSNWREMHSIGDWSVPSVEGSYTDGGTPLFQQVLVQGDYAFVTSDKSSGGAGLYVFDISNLASPQRVASSFSLPGNGHAMVMVGTNLVVISEATTAEVLYYDISDPENLNAGNLIDSVDVPGDGRARSVAYYGGHLYVGATEDGTEQEMYSYSIDDTSITLEDSHDTDGTLYEMVLKDGYAYMASGENVAELRVVDVFDPQDLQDAPGNGYNLTDVDDAYSIYGFGTGMLLGRSEGSVIEEIILFDIADSVIPSPPPGPFYFEVSGNVHDVTVEPGGRYAFIASDFTDKELQVLQPNVLVAGGSAEVSYYDAGEAGQGVYYDLAKDRVFFVTNSSLYILQPSE